MRSHDSLCSAHIIILIRRVDLVLFFLSESKVEVREKQRYGPLHFFRIYFCFFDLASFAASHGLTSIWFREVMISKEKKR